MKIEIEIPDVSTAAKAINNAAIAYGKVIGAIIFGCDVPKGFEPLCDRDENELKQQYNCLKDIVRQLDLLEDKNEI